MPQFVPGVYTILPKGSNKAPAFGIGPIPYIWPPPDVPVRVLDKFIDSWTIDSTENNTFVVFAFAGKGPVRPSDYKWIVKENKGLFVSSVKEEPGSFRFESAGNGLWKIGIFGEDAVLTYDAKSKGPQLTFKPANGSDEQLFQAVPKLED